MTHKQILQLALKKMTAGVKKYGRFDVRTDKRNFFEEQIAEQLDTINYAAFQIQRIQRAQREWERHEARSTTQEKPKSKRLPVLSTKSVR